MTKKYKIMDEFNYKEVGILGWRWSADALTDHGTKRGKCRGIYRMRAVEPPVILYGGSTTSENKSSSCRLRLQSHRLSFTNNNRNESTGLKVRQYMKDNNLSEMRVIYEYVDMSDQSNEDILKAEKYAIKHDKPLFNVKDAA